LEVKRAAVTNCNPLTQTIPTIKNDDRPWEGIDAFKQYFYPSELFGFNIQLHPLNE